MTAIAGIGSKRPGWQTTIMFALGFWLSSSLIIDLAIMPSLYVAGMMTQEGFAAAGYIIFWIFNRIELLCAALTVTGLLVLQKSQPNFFKAGDWAKPSAVALSIILLSIALIYTYILTPQMSALGLQLNLFEPATTTTSAAMSQMHSAYWLLEISKLAIIGTLFGWFYRRQG